MDAVDVAGRRDALRRAVLDAAEARVAASGLVDLGVRDIARDAGCSSGMVYKLFSNHDALVLAVNARTLEALGAAVAASVRGAASPAAAMTAMADAYLDYAQAHTRRWDALFAHRMADGATLPPGYAAQRDRLFAVLAAALGAGPSPLSDADFARTVFSAVHGVVALGLEQKVGAVSPGALRTEMHALVCVLARGMFGERA